MATMASEGADRTTAAGDRAQAGVAHPATRVILWIDLVLLVSAGSQLNLHPDRTGEFFAWVIPVTLTAAFLGIGYWVAAPSLIMAVRNTRWAEVRIVLIAALTLMTVELIVTVQDFDPFLLSDAPGLAMLSAWIWVIGYIVLPPLNAVAILVNRGTDTTPPSNALPLRPWALAVLAVYAVTLTIFGLGMLFFSGTFDSLWPWPVTRLTAGAISGWLLLLAAVSWWGLRERTWAAFRIGVPFYVLWFLFQLVNVARFRDDLVDGVAPVMYVIALGVSMVVFAAIGVIHERAARTSAPEPTPAAA
jgi:hypothetical protein